MFKVLIVVSMILATFSVPAQAQWTYHGEYDGNMEDGLFVGATTERTFAEDDEQPMQISGAGMSLPTGGSRYQVDFHFEGYSWDSYVPYLGDETGTGWLDVFTVALTEKNKGFYWQLGNTDIHPLYNNPDVILATPVYVNDTPWWSGQNYEDHLLESDVSDVQLFFDADPLKEYYLNVFLQTNDDEDLPSWGKFSNVSAKVVPEPVSSVLFLLGGGALAVFRRKKK